MFFVWLPSHFQSSVLDVSAVSSGVCEDSWRSSWSWWDQQETWDERWQSSSWRLGRHDEESEEEENEDAAAAAGVTAAASGEPEAEPDAFEGRWHYKITVNRISGSSFKLEVASCTSVGEVKAQIQRKQGLPQEQQQLVFDEVILENDRTLRSYDIKNRSTWSLIEPSLSTDADS